MPDCSGREDVEFGRCVIVATCAVFRKTSRGTETLILKRSEEEQEGGGLWTIPGGKVQSCDLGERIRADGISHFTWLCEPALERAVLREIKEETGIMVNFAYPLWNKAKFFIRKDGTFTLCMLHWTECPSSTAVTIGGESTDYRWVWARELDDHNFIGNVKDDIIFSMRCFDKV